MEKLTKFSIVDELKTSRDIISFLEASIEEARNDEDATYIKNALEIALKAYAKIGKVRQSIVA